MEVDVIRRRYVVRLIFFNVYFLLFTFYSIFATRIGIYGFKNPRLYTELE